MEKTAQRPRGHSSDPVQEKLREDKASWNEEASAFIARLNSFKPKLIAFKRGLNGRGDQKAGLPASNIKEPLPSQVPSYLGLISNEFQALTSSFDALISGAGGIVNEQAQYSRTRKKPQQKKSNLNFTEDELVAIASNPFSRWWARTTGRFSAPSSLNEYRLSMLRSATDFYHLIKDFEDILLLRGTKNLEDIDEAWITLTRSLEDLNRLGAEILSMLDSKMVPSSPKIDNTDYTELDEDDLVGDTSENSPKEEAEVRIPASDTPEVSRSTRELPVREMVSNMENLRTFASAPIKTEIKEFISLVRQWNSKQFSGPVQKNLKDQFIWKYQKIMNMFSKEIESAIGMKIPYDASFQELKETKEKGSLADELTTKTANPIGRLFGNISHTIWNDKTTAYRKDLYRKIDHMREVTNKLLSSLEKSNVSAASIRQCMDEIKSTYEGMKKPMVGIRAGYKNSKILGDTKRVDKIRDRVDNREFLRLIRDQGV